MVEEIVGFLTGAGGLWALCLSAFLSSTVLPGGSEVLFSAILIPDHSPQRMLLLTSLAACFNTFGSMTTWAMGRFIPHKDAEGPAIERIRRWGAAALFFAWVPVVGDALPFAAGWLRISFWKAFFWTALGKTARYAALALAVAGAAQTLG